MNFETRKAIDAYLDLVDTALLNSQIGRSRRTGIARDLELHVLEELRARTGENEPTADDVRAVLAGLGSPDSFAATTTPATPIPAAPQSRPHRTLPPQIRWAALLIPLSFFGTLILAATFGRGHREDPSEFLILMIAATPITLMMLLGSALGWIAHRKIRENPTRHWGRFFAVIEMAAFPLMVVIASPLLFLTLALTATLIYVANRTIGLRSAMSKLLAGA